ncbi:Glycerophosphodiester phosphodiesterase 1 [Trichinella pseudospiralis]|uniref:Glycerophosphodiester phosphodiesterase 1 n=1 Tax=Trichinella pseudospiralis TaxID=6337 RepID=A0A0V0Y181_TRIPS|nr:Glycerophosphodiester phosphodiesterase 1 [Trichinella pseudospiralis]
MNVRLIICCMLKKLISFICSKTVKSTNLLVNCKVALGPISGLFSSVFSFVTKSTATMEQWIAQTLLMIVVLMAPAAALLLGCSRSRWMCFILLGVVSTVCFLCVCVWISLFCDQQHAGDQPNLRQFLRNFTFGAHRGLADEAPENTLAAFEYSAKLGSTFVEFDLEMTADNTPVLMHDDTVDRTTNGTGFIGQLDDDYKFFRTKSSNIGRGSFVN